MSDGGSPRDARSTARPAGARGPRGGPLLLVVPLAVTVAVVWWTRAPRESVLPQRPPAREDPETTHDVLGGEASLGGATLSFWLAPSETDPERQAFQSKALRKRYGLPDGAIWRLRLELARDAGSSADAPALDVAALAVDDAEGRALSPLQLGKELDPLATLLGPPRAPLGPGTGLDLFLWGRAPGAGARLSGIPGAVADLSFHTRTLRSADLVGPMARLDAAEDRPAANGGKSAPQGPSKVPVRGSDASGY